ncbi:MAG: tetratricopeptide repeat protein [Bacteroidales bacterium]|nr:tetratricopeptide repeat protein [Bacteroidales bacterium]
MKKIFLTLTVAAMAATSVFSQAPTPQDSKKLIDNAKAKIENSDKDIQDAKKGSISKTWESRGKLLLESAKINTKGVNQGMYAAKCDQSPFFNLELMMGAPTEKKSEKIGTEDYEVWVYPTINYYIQNNQVMLWKETYTVADNALDKAVEAYRKADELDAKGSFKSKKTTMEAAKELRTAYFTNGINAYQLLDYKTAAKNFESAYNLSDFPRDPKDTSLNDGQIAYYAALSAYQGDEKVKAEKLFKEAANKNYQPGGCYHYIYQINMDNGKEAEALKLITTAYEKYPQEEQILYDVINYYLGKKQTEEAEKYLDKAIEKYPSNASLYNVKASMFVTQCSDLSAKYANELNESDSLRKLAFRNRNNPKEEARVNAEKEKKQADAEQTKKDYLASMNKAVSIYNQAISKDAKNYDAHFALGIVYYSAADLVNNEKNSIPLSEDKDGSKTAAKEKEITKYWEQSAEEFEKASAIRPTEKDCLQNLKTLYYKLQNTAKWKEVKEKLEKL